MGEEFYWENVLCSTSYLYELAISFVTVRAQLCNVELFALLE